MKTASRQKAAHALDSTHCVRPAPGFFRPVSQALAFLSAVWLGVPGAAAQTFPPQGDDSTPSMGVFRITVDPFFRPLMGPFGALVPYTGYNTVDGKLTSPLLIDNSTTIGRSSPNSRPYAFGAGIPIGA